MEDVPEAEVEALAGQARVSALVVVKESSATHAAAAEQRAEAPQDAPPPGAYLT